MSRSASVNINDGFVVVGRSGMMRKPSNAMGIVMMPSMMNNPAKM